MKVWELQEILEFANEDAEVRIAMQPSYPFEYTISSMDYYQTDDVVYLSEGHQVGYLPQEVSNQLGW